MKWQNKDEANQNNKALRGIQISDKDGAVEFETIIPGHYMGRTNHIHGKYCESLYTIYLMISSYVSHQSYCAAK